ncbi:MAG: O-antigen ligase family protein, partial [Acidobacteriota bacterium]
HLSREGEGGIALGSSPELLPGAAGFFLAFRTVTVLLAVRAFGQDPDVGTAANVGLDFLFLAVVAFCTLADRSRERVGILRLPVIRWALLFLGFSCCSLLWSSTVSLSNSSLSWCAMASDVGMVALLLQARSLEHPAEALMQGYVWGACAVALIAWIMPAESDLRLGDAELLGPNQIGYVCALAFYFAQYLVRETRRGPVLAAGFLAVTLLRSLSKTTIVAFMVSQGFLLVRDRSMSRRTKVLVAVAAVILIAVFWSLLASYYDVYTGAGNQSETLTGRFGIWAYFFAEAIQQPWFGHGFDSAWKVIPPFGADEFQAAHAHNELLQQFYGYGAVGVGLFAGIYGSLFLQIRKVAARRERLFFLALLIFVLVRGLADTDRFDLSLPLWSILMVAWLTESARLATVERTDSTTERYARRTTREPSAVTPATDPTG